MEFKGRVPHPTQKVFCGVDPPRDPAMTTFKLFAQVGRWCYLDFDGRLRPERAPHGGPPGASPPPPGARSGDPPHSVGPQADGIFLGSFLACAGCDSGLGRQIVVKGHAVGARRETVGTNRGGR